jgi:hypothetical protein
MPKMQNGLLGFPRNGNQEILTLNRGPNIGFTIAARYGDTGLQIPVPTMRPTVDNSSFALDLAPKGPNPVEFPGNGFTWLDVCDNDVQDSNYNNGTQIPVRCARVSMTSTGARFGSVSFNGASALPIEFIYNSTAGIVARMTDVGFCFGSATRTPVSRIEATDDTVVNFLNVFSGEGVIGTSTNHPLSFWTNNVKRAILNTAGDLNGLSSITRTGGVSIEGTNTNDNASAGRVGEYISASREVGSLLALTTGTPVNVTSISLTAGDWLVNAQAYLNLAATTSYTSFISSISGTSATLDATAGRLMRFDTPAAVPGNVNITFGAMTYRLKLAATTTIYLVSQATFTASTANTWGYIGATRVR